MLPPRVSEHNWWWCAWRSKTPQWPHWLSSARLPGSRTSFCALSWQSPHRPGGVQITGQCDWESNRDNLYRQDTGRCQGTQVMLCKWNMTSDTNSHVAAITGYRTGNPAKMLLQSVGWEANITSGARVWSQLLLDHMRVSQDHWPRKILWTVIFYWCNLKSWTCHHLFPKVKGWPQNQD